MEILGPPIRNDRWPWFSRAVSVALSAFSDQPAKAFFSRRSGLGRAALERAGRIAGRIMVINGSDSYWFADAYGAGASGRVLVCHNIESLLYRRQIDTFGPLGRLVLRHFLHDDAKLTELENRAFSQSDLVLCISSEDASFVTANFPGVCVHHLPPTFEGPPKTEGRAPPAESAPLRLGFLAKFSWWPNVDAVDWLIREILPQLPEDRELHLFGLGSENYDTPAKRIVAHGFVPDLADVWRACDIVLCPMRAGGGVNVKFAEALYNRMPVCATPLAARGTGIEVANVRGLRFLDEAAEWIEFLGSDAARAFAAAPPGPEISAHFAMGGQVEPLRTVFRGRMFGVR